MNAFDRLVTLRAEIFTRRLLLFIPLLGFIMLVFAILQPSLPGILLSIAFTVITTASCVYASRAWRPVVKAAERRGRLDKATYVVPFVSGRISRSGEADVKLRLGWAQIVGDGVEVFLWKPRTVDSVDCAERIVVSSNVYIASTVVLRGWAYSHLSIESDDARLEFEPMELSGSTFRRLSDSEVEGIAQEVRSAISQIS